MTAGSAPLLALTTIALLLFWRGFVRLRSRGRYDHAGWDRPLLFTIALAIAAVALLVLDRAADRLLWAHMLQHVLIGDLVPALLLVALRGPLLAFVLPTPLAPALGRLMQLPAWSAAALWVAAIGVWHVPRVYDYALSHPVVHELEHISFATAGLLVWTQLIDPSRRRRLSTPQRLALAGSLFATGQLLSDILFLSHPLYSAYDTGTADQQLAGLVMMVEQTLTLGTLTVILLRNSLRSPSRRPTRAAARA